MTAPTTHSPKSGRKPRRVGPKPSDLRAFQKTVWEHYRARGRDLPWRRTRDPYRILVSELMLQQTQATRVVPKYEAFLMRFPTLQKLARAPLSEVLRAWQGLGYNRRAKYLHESARTIVSQHDGKVPHSYDELMQLPGVGDYTAKAVRVFAWNQPEILIETNIRTVCIRNFFPRRSDVADTELIAVLRLVLPKQNSREWYWALMDYGAHLKKTEGNASRQSAHHTRQKPFQGSNREVRGAILRSLSSRPLVLQDLFSLPFSRKRVERARAELIAEGLIQKKRNTLSLVD